MTKVVINEALQQLRKEEAFLVPLHESQIGELPDEEPEVEGFDSQMLLAFVRKLPPGYRAVFNLFVIEEKSHQEIAEILQIKPNTSASQYLRAKKLLIEMIQEYKLQTEDR
jgi:RNA polymerase sigma-70 factor (ECF subfamily)